jgi:hypothetical protein
MTRADIDLAEARRRTIELFPSRIDRTINKENGHAEEGA